MHERLQTENGRKLVAAIAALQTNPRLKRQRQVVLWLFRGMPSPPLNRQSGAAGQAGSSGQPAAAAKAINRETEGSEKDSSSTESN